jgi:hypothetical protein
LLFEETTFGYTTALFAFADHIDRSVGPCASMFLTPHVYTPINSSFFEQSRHDSNRNGQNKITLTSPGTRAAPISLCRINLTQFPSTRHSHVALADAPPSRFVPQYTNQIPSSNTTRMHVTHATFPGENGVVRCTFPFACLIRGTARSCYFLVRLRVAVLGGACMH